MEKNKRLLGVHVSVSGGVDKGIERGVALGCTAIQIFVKNNNQWFSKPLPQDMIERFLNLRKKTDMFVFAHTGYLINLASPKTETHRTSMYSMLDELKRSESLQLPFIILHPGAHVGEGKEAGIKTVAKSLDQLLKKTKDYKVKIALENTAGQGTSLGSEFKELAEIIKQCEFPERLGVCVDTCHLFSSKYDIRTKEGYEKTWHEFKKTIGLNKLLAIHLNDSKREFGAHVDRHQHIGQGTIGKKAFALLLNDPRFKNLPMIIETPDDGSDNYNRMNLETLRKLII